TFAGSDRLTHDSGETICSSPRDLDGENATEEARLGLCVDRLEVGGSADQLPGASAHFLEQNREHLADTTRIKAGLLGLEQILQPGQPVGLDLLGYLLTHVGRWCARPRTVLERECLCETHLAYKLERGLEILLRLAGEADDHGGR